MLITYEATDPVITFGPIEPSGPSYWTTVWKDGPTAGHGGPSNGHADTGKASAFCKTSRVGATMSLEFYGTAISVYGVDRDYSSLWTIDDRELGNVSVGETDSLLYGVSKLTKRWHTFQVKIVDAPQETSLLAVERVEIDTGLADTFERVASYGGDSSIWELAGNWEHRKSVAQGATASFRSQTRWETATIAGGLAGPSIVFLYGTVGPDYGILQVMWTTNETSPEAGLSVQDTELSTDSDSELPGAVIWMGIVPEKGWSRFQVQNIDGRGRMVEITRLDVYALPGSGVTSSGGPSETSESSPSPPSSHISSSSSSASPAAVGGAVAGSVVIIAAIIALLIMRRRRQRDLMLYNGPEITSGATFHTSPQTSELTASLMVAAPTTYLTESRREKRGVGSGQTSSLSRPGAYSTTEASSRSGGNRSESVEADFEERHENILPAYTESPAITPLRL